MLVDIIFLLIFLLGSGFFSGIEIAFISSDRLQVELQKKKGSPRGRILAGFQERPSEFLGTTLVGNNIVLVILAKLFDEFVKTHQLLPSFILEDSVTLMLSVTVIMTIILLIFGEFLPKVSFQINPTGILFLFAYPLSFVKFLLTPIVWVMVQSSYAVLALIFKIKPEPDQQVFSRIDLEHFINNIQTSEQDGLDKTLFQNALYIGEVKVKDCIVPRNEIVRVPIDIPIQELRQRFIESRVSRIIVCGESVDDILGYVHHQQLFQHVKQLSTDILLPIPVVSEFTNARDLMNRFIKKKLNIAWVVDEYGGTAGIVTLEDILEEIFGEISDEHDKILNLHKQESQDEYIFAGRIEIDFINDTYQLNLPEGDDYQTLSGFIVTHLESIPEQGQKIRYNGYEFLFERVSNTRIERVRVRRLQDTVEAEE
ncbi:MAG: hemolysin family protein [Saprospiraceae bacterium]|nr:hemolysin family protein [Saprospiraceae bacterium]